MATLGAVPPDAQLKGLSLRVFQVLAKYTAFPWPILQAQCDRVRVSPESLTVSELMMIIDHIAEGVARFASPEKGAAVSDELWLLVDSGDYGHELRESPVRAISDPPPNSCPDCRSPNQTGRFCADCGRPLSGAARCPKCGAASSGRFCSECGAAMRSRT